LSDVLCESEALIAPPAGVAARSGQAVRAVIVVPVYNHAGAVTDVLSRVAMLGHEILVIDDGSTDETPARLSQWTRANSGARASVLTHPSNLGKAAALRTGFDRALQGGATHAVTIDADGQLDPDDIPGLLELAVLHPRALILGRRPDRMAGCPARCIVGRRNASLAVLAQTGLRLSDTQCGWR
jgi:glycosyltransferase involved in cell wall biosynthesis